MGEKVQTLFLQNQLETVPVNKLYLVLELLSQFIHHFGVQTQEHDQRGGCAGCGFMPAKQQLCGRLLDGLQTETHSVAHMKKSCGRALQQVISSLPAC